MIGAGYNPRVMMVDLIKSMRPHQWVKNLFVLAPLVFSQRLLELPMLSRAAFGAFLFCMVSGVVYLMNDVFDAEKDRAHPTKRLRPVASGRLPAKVAATAAGLIGLSSLAVALWLDWRFGAVAVAYLIVNALYSWKLKHVAVVDVSTIALGFLLRTLAGAFVIGVSLSEWLFGCTFLLALFLGLGKRKHEILQAGDRGAEQRRVLDNYRLEHLNYALLCVAGLTIAAYTAYALSVSLPGQPLHPSRAPFESHWMPATIPFAVIGLFRFYMLISRSEDADSPTDRMIRDLPFLINLGLWGAAILVMIYLD